MAIDPQLTHDPDRDQKRLNRIRANYKDMGVLHPIDMDWLFSTIQVYIWQTGKGPPLSAGTDKWEEQSA
jgi:hypothetical protein